MLSTSSKVLVIKSIFKKKILFEKILFSFDDSGSLFSGKKTMHLIVSRLQGTLEVVI